MATVKRHTTMPDPSPEQILALINNARAALDLAAAALTGQPITARPAPVAAVADDADLDGQYGNPTVRKDPPRWTGQSYAGARYSDCPPDYLDMLAGLLDWQAGKSAEKNEMTNNGKPRADYLKKDAARARGWAARARAKTAGRPAAARPKPATMNDPDDDQVPF